MKKLGASRNQCQGCKEYFNSTSAFDLHRVGDHGINRRCETKDEMLARGMSLNEDEFWVTEQYQEKAHKKAHET